MGTIITVIGLTTLALIPLAVFVAICSGGWIAFCTGVAKVRKAERPKVPHSVSYSNHTRPMLPPVQRPQLAAPIDVTPEPEDVQPEPLPLWLPEVIGHDGQLLIVGGTGDGKTTLLKRLLEARARTDKIVILDPHAKYNDWAGLAPIGGGRNYAAIAEAVKQIDAEFNRRFAPDEDNGENITVFIDEYNSITDNRPDLKGYFRAFVCESRKTGMRFVFSSTEYNVEALGLKGRSDVRKSLLQVFLGSFARERHPQAKHHYRPAVLVRHGDDPRLIDRSGLLRDIRPLPDSVVWSAPEVYEPTVQPAVHARTPNGWTDDHYAAAELLLTNPNPSKRAAAAYLWPDKVAAGDRAMKAGRILDDVRNTPNWAAYVPNDHPAEQPNTEREGLWLDMTKVRAA